MGVLRTDSFCTLDARHLPPFLPYLLYLLPSLLRRNPYILIKILQTLMPADLHDQFRWGACQLAYFLNMPIQLLVCRFWDLIFEAVYDNVICCGAQRDNNPVVGLSLFFVKHPVADIFRPDTAVVGEPQSSQASQDEHIAETIQMGICGQVNFAYGINFCGG